MSTTLRDLEKEDQAAKLKWHKEQQLPQPVTTAENLQPVWDAQAERAKIDKVARLSQEHPEIRALAEELAELKRAEADKRPTIPPKEVKQAKTPHK